MSRAIIAPGSRAADGKKPRNKALRGAWGLAGRTGQRL